MMCFHDGGTTPLYALGVGVERGTFSSYTNNGKLGVSSPHTPIVDFSESVPCARILFCLV